MKLIYYVSLTILIPLGILGIVILFKSVKISNYISKLLPEETKTRKNLDLFVSVFRTKKELSLFRLGLAYIEEKETRELYFFTSFLAVVFSFSSFIKENMPPSFLFLIISLLILFLNIIFYSAGKYVLKRFKKTN